MSTWFKTYNFREKLQKQIMRRHFDFENSNFCSRQFLSYFRLRSRSGNLVKYYLCSMAMAGGQQAAGVPQAHFPQSLYSRSPAMFGGLPGTGKTFTMDGFSVESKQSGTADWQPLLLDSSAIGTS